MFSIFILTYNEALDIAACIESAAPCDDIIVVDSFSSDATPAIVQELAQQHPVRLVQHRFESHGKQRTWMLQADLAQHEWAYILEADERMTPELYQECCEAVAAATAAAQSDPETAPVGFFAAERVMFMGSWIRHSTQYPRYQLRLLNRRRAWFTDYGHTEREVCEGPTGWLKATYPTTPPAKASAAGSTSTTAIPAMKPWRPFASAGRARSIGTTCCLAKRRSPAATPSRIFPSTCPCGPWLDLFICTFYWGAGEMVGRVSAGASCRCSMSI